MVKNVIEDVVVPESPKVLPNEQLHVYVPTASNNQKGIAKFSEGAFEVVDGEVKLKEKYLNDVGSKSFVSKSNLPNKIYVTNDTGEDVNIPYSVEAYGNNVVCRSDTGEVIVPRSTKNSDAAVSLTQLNEGLAKNVPVVKDDALDERFLYSYFYDKYGKSRLVKADSELDSELTVRLQDGHVRVPYKPDSKFTVDTAVSSKYLFDNYKTANETEATDIYSFDIEQAKDENATNLFGVYDFKITLNDGTVFTKQLDLPLEAVQIASVNDYVSEDGKRYLEIRFVDENIHPLNIELDEIFGDLSTLVADKLDAGSLTWNEAKTALSLEGSFIKSSMTTEGFSAEDTSGQSAKVASDSVKIKTNGSSFFGTPTQEAQYEGGGIVLTNYDKDTTSMLKYPDLPDGTTATLATLDDIPRNDDDSATNHSLCTFLDAYTAWCNGESFPIAFYGDSTFEGYGVGRDNAFCAKLQKLLREECGENVQIHNFGYSGEDLDYALEKFDELFGEGSYFSNVKMVGIGFGINDRLHYSTYQDYKNGVYEKYEALIKKFFARGIQPFLVTSQAILQCGVGTSYTNYVLRDSNSINVCANGAKKELASKYGIPLLDLTTATELFLTNSNVAANVIIPDNIHFGDIGHQFEAGYMFSKFVPRTICHKGQNKKVLSYANQNLRSAVPDDKLSFGGDFKAYANYEKSNTADTKIFDAYVFVKDFPTELHAFKNDGGATYVKVNGQAFALPANKYYINTLDLGLHHLEVFTGSSSKVNFNGFVLEAAKENRVIAEEPMVWKDGYCVLGSDGTEVAYAPAACTDFVNLRGASNIVFFGKDRYSGDARMCFYDLNKNYLSYKSYSQNSENFSIPENAVYAKFNEKLADRGYVTYFSDTFTNGFTNLDSTKFVAGQLPYNNELGHAPSGTADGYFDVSIPVQGGTTLYIFNAFKFKGETKTVYPAAYGYDSEGKLVGMVDRAACPGNGVCISYIPSGVASVKITGTDTTYDNVWYKVR